MYQIWIDTGGTFTDGLALDPDGNLNRTKVLSSSRLRGQLVAGKLVAPWLNAPIFDGYQLRIVETGEIYSVVSLQTDGTLVLDQALTSISSTTTVELFTDEEAPVLAARLLTQTPLNQPFPALEMRLGTTKGTNALLERKGGNVALLVTKGFKDLLKIGTQQRPDLFQLAIPPAEVLYDSVLEVEERMAADGQPLTTLSDEAIAALIDQIQQAKPDAVAVSLLNAYRNPIHEHKLRYALTEAGFPYVTISTDVSTAPQYVARTQTAVVDAYLTPVMRSYLDNVQQQLGNQSVRIMTSTGGLVRTDLFRPKDSLLSGPAGGVIGAATIADSLLQSSILTLDMGGTSTDVARIQGNLDYRFSTKIGPFDLQLPSLAIETVAAGGGSICWFDGTGSTTGQLRVGPQSAGANPGPACYGAGPRSARGPNQTSLLTITDVNLLLGKLDPQQFGIPIFPEKAQEALDQLIQQIEAKTGSAPTAPELLRGFERIANETMAGAIRKISVARGFDPKEYGLLVFGGAGGLHGCAIARLLGMERIILPFDGGLLSAYGIGQAQIERMASRSVLRLMKDVYEKLEDLIDEVSHEAWNKLIEDVPGGLGNVKYRYLLYLRLAGQEQAIEFEVLDDWFWDTDIYILSKMSDIFREKYQQLYGHLPADRPIEVESIRVIVSTASVENPVNSSPVSHHHAVPTFESNSYPIYDWTQLQEGDTFRGPALLLNTTSSAFIESGWRLIVQADKNAVVEYIEDVDEPTVVETNEIIQLELFTQRFRAIAEEMGAQLQRTAFRSM
jgi:5-oxoprolinase (ATP-hydrolysing)